VKLVTLALNWRQSLVVTSVVTSAVSSVVHCTARMVNKKRSDSLSKIWGFLAILIHEMRVHISI
jgi:hypothetical protein